MNISVIFACLIAKLLHGLLILFGKGGTSLPGKAAQTICPDVLSQLAKSFHVISVTGTNGKTTTSRMLETEFLKAGYSVFANRSGANLPCGIVTEFILNVTIFGKPKKDWAIIECDEAACTHVFEEIQPHVVVVTNLFRDQLDRYGEIFCVRDYIIRGIEKVPNALVCLNADCALTASIAEQIKNSIRYFGIEKSAAIATLQPSALSDAAHCLRCGSKYLYSYVTYAHLGGFYCPKCGDRRKNADVAVIKIPRQTQDGSSIVWTFGEKEFATDIRLPAIYNIYNALAAAASANAAGIEAASIVNAVSDFTNVFGRMERIVQGRTDCTMILVKNPTAFNQALEHICKTEEKLILVLGLNDFAADGRDISWIWDVNFEKLCQMESRIKQIIIFGRRYADMALRLKYAGISDKKFTFVKDRSTKKVSRMIQAAQCKVYVLPTYTAMLSLRRTLIKKHGADFWG